MGKLICVLCVGKVYNHVGGHVPPQAPCVLCMVHHVLCQYGTCMRVVASVCLVCALHAISMFECEPAVLHLCLPSVLLVHETVTLGGGYASCVLCMCASV